MTGQIVKIISNHFTVKSNNTLYDCMASGNLRNNRVFPLAGDYVEFDETKNILQKYYQEKMNLLDHP